MVNNRGDFCLDCDFRVISVMGYDFSQSQTIKSTHRLCFFGGVGALCKDIDYRKAVFDYLSVFQIFGQQIFAIVNKCR